LQHCELGGNPEILSVILQSDVRYINLDNNNIDSLGAVKIAEYLEGDPPIHRIDLDHNRLNDDDAILISQALKRNTNLERLFIRWNNFTSSSVKALLTCFFDSSSLNSLSESNHTLISIWLFSEESNFNFTLKRLDLFTRQKNGSLAGCIHKLLELDRTEKIVLALQDKDSLLKYLANVPVELMPEVLTFPHEWVANEHKGKHLHRPLASRKHLNVVYSTMRWWRMPMLYSYHNCVNSEITKTKRKRKLS
jgi:hypothetical protein